MVVQVIGLPCSGKTTAIKTFLEMNPSIKHIDIRDYKNENEFKKAVTSFVDKKVEIVAESASGFYIEKTKVIKLEIPKMELYSRSLVRDKTFDADYLSLLETVMLRTKYTVSTKDGLIALLSKMFEAKQ
jgi:ABC-type Mn2+/Zn2+ transport system ATPase subunit